MTKSFRPFLLAFIAAVLAPVAIHAATTDTNAVDAANLASFEHKVALAKEMDATHVVITESLPLATWEFEVMPEDPYPAWFVHHASLLKIFPPKQVQPYVNSAYAERVSRILEQRCAVLRKYGLHAAWIANEPAVMPEAFFTAYPELRGPRIDQPNRARRAHFAPCVDQPQTLALYRESIQLLLKRCPEVDFFNWVTTDAGSGFCWAPSLYPGINGHSDCKDRPMEDRVAGFMVNIQTAAREAGHDIEININPISPRQWMIPTFSPEILSAIVKKLPRGLAVQGREGPDGRPMAGSARGNVTGSAFYPVLGIPVPSLEAAGGRGAQRPTGTVARVLPGTAAGDGDVATVAKPDAAAAPAAAVDVPRKPRRIVSVGDDQLMQDFNVRLYRATGTAPAKNQLDRLTALRAFAVSEVGEEQADNLMETWVTLNEAERNLNILNFGGMLRFGHVLNRWINRPMVPFPEELKPAEKDYYRPYLFQAKGEEQANDLADIQAMQMYKGYGAKLLFQRVMETVIPQVSGAQVRVERLKSVAKDDQAKKQWDIVSKRLEAAVCLLRSADNMVAYQAQLDRVKSLGIKPEPDPVLGVQSSWDRTDLMETARKEIDNTVHLMRLLEGTKDPILDLAPTQAEESSMRLGPNLIPELKRKIDTMNAHWEDYKRLFTTPNP